MAFTPKFVDLVRNLTSVTGTGPVTLGQAVSGYTSLASAVSAGDQFYYCLQSVDKPQEREIGRGTMQADGKVARQPVFGSPTNFTSGTKTIALVAAAEWFSKLDQLGDGMGAAASRAELAGRDASTAGRAFLAEPGRAGSFIFDPANLSAKVSADPAQGIHIAPASDPSGASGAWVRRFDGSVNVKWFGAKGDGVASDGPAFVAALAALKAMAVNTDIFHGGSQCLFAPAGTYNLGTTTLDITHQTIIEGEGTLIGNGSRLVWSGDCTGIRVQAYNTVGATAVTAPGQNAGAYTVIRRIGLVGPHFNVTNFTGLSEGEHHGIHARSNIVVEDVYINGFAGDGLYSRASVGSGAPNEGNSNCSFVNRLVVYCCRNGVYLDGADVNAWTLTGVVGLYCRQHTVWDSSFLGNTHIGHHSANAGLVPGVPPSVVSHNGKTYGVRQGRTATASTNPPSGTTADNADWLYIAPGGAVAALNILPWSNGMALREGGGYRSDNPNARNTFIGCYQEGGEAPFQFVSPTIVMGGFMPVTSNSTGNVYQGDVLLAPNGVKLGQSQVAADLGPTESVLTVTNSHALTNAYKSRLRIAQGYEADGVTPCKLVDLIGISIGADPATNKAEALLALRDTGGAMSTVLNVAPFSNASVYPEGDNWLDWGLGVFRYKTIYGYTGDFKTQVKVNGTKVVGAQGAALPADATDLATAMSLVNAIKARLVAHGLVSA